MKAIRSQRCCRAQQVLLHPAARSNMRMRRESYLSRRAKALSAWVAKSGFHFHACKSHKCCPKLVQITHSFHKKTTTTSDLPHLPLPTFSWGITMRSTCFKPASWPWKGTLGQHFGQPKTRLSLWNVWPLESYSAAAVQLHPLGWEVSCRILRDIEMCEIEFIGLGISMSHPVANRNIL